MLSVEVKIRLASLLWIYRSTELCSPERTPGVHLLQVKTSVTNGWDPPRPRRPRARTRYHYGAATEEPRRAVTSACPHRPLRARPRRLKRCARGAGLWSRLRALNGPVPYQVRMTLERPEPQARKT
jgi:hypothetical protein